ncbi:MAG: 3-isopropylmalate dehydratase large subunit [Candidatus Omnitrophica bacterium]|nr:3-isopropylmalate dehydratase large subunit [Candidatus Omnitrophota bacterium]
MKQTMTQKILARHTGKSSVEPGENVWVNADVLMTHDICGPGTIGIFKQEFGPKARVWDPDKVVIVPDHYIWTEDAKARRNVDILREFAEEQGIKNYYDVGERYKGVCHIALPEEGHTRPGEVLFGTDSHTCTAGAFGEFATGIGNSDAAFVLGTGKLWVKVPETMRFVFHGKRPPYLMAKDLILTIIGDIGTDGATYRAMEFAGDGVMSLSVEERMTLCNMVIEAGGKNGVIEPDDVTQTFVRARTGKAFEPLHADPGAQYINEKEYDVSRLEPTVAKPHSPDNRALARELKGHKLNRAYLGSCTGGKIEDYQAAARILKGRRVKIETFVVPATTFVAKEIRRLKMDNETLYEIFEKAGCQMGEPGCQACLGGPQDTFARANGAEVVISSTNRNYPGRMGSPRAQIYLASPLTVAASALTGHITDPREFIG